MQLFQLRLSYRSGIEVPPCPLGRKIYLVKSNLMYLHKESVDVSSLLWGCSKLISCHGIGDLTYETHLVQRQFVLPCSALHDCRQEGLWVEEARKPDGGRKSKVCNPAVELPNSQQKVGVPGGQPVQRGICKLGPVRRHLEM